MAGRCAAAAGRGRPGGTSTRRPSRADRRPSSASCTPRAPAAKSQRERRRPSTTCRRNASHCALNPLSNSSLSGTSLPLRRGSPRWPAGPGSTPASAWCARCWTRQSPQPGDRAALGAVDLELDQLVAVDPHRPGGVDLGDDAAVAARRSRTRRRRRSPRTRSPRSSTAGAGCASRRAQCTDRTGAKSCSSTYCQCGNMSIDDAAAVGGPVVPGRALRRLPVALEDPVAELAAHRQDAAEEAAVDEPLRACAARAGTACPARRRA